MDVRVLVTGGIGFVGSHVASALQEQHPEWRLAILDLQLPRVPRPNVSYEIGDVTETSSVDSTFEKVKPTVVVHTAGLVPALAKRYSREQQEQVYCINVEGTRNVLEAAKKHGTKAFVWTGSCTAVTDDMRREYRNIDECTPTSAKSLIYGETKVSHHSSTSRIEY